MDLVLCHQTADFDALGAAVGLTRLRKGGRFVLTGGAHPAVKEFLALYRDELAILERRSVDPQQIRRLVVVDTQKRDRLGMAAQWLDLAHVEGIEVYDHHAYEGDIPATFTLTEPVGATTTMIVEQLAAAGVGLTPVEATVMALGIHADTGSLTYEQTTPRDARALAWLMEQGANVQIIGEYIEPGLSPQLQNLLSEGLEQLHKETVQGYTVAWVLLETSEFIPGLSGLASRLVDLTEADALLLGHSYGRRSASNRRLSIIGRSHIPQTNVAQLLDPLGGGGHPQAASVTLAGKDPQATLKQLVEQLKAQIPHPPTARELMSSPVRTIRPDTTVGEAQRILLRYGHSGLSVVDEHDQLVGIISRRDLDLALHHGFAHAPVKGYMSRNLKTIAPDTLLPEIESLMVTYDVGRLPVLENGQLLGIVTRTDVLRQIHQERGLQPPTTGERSLIAACLLPQLHDRLLPALWEFLQQAARQAEQRGWHLYLVGGAVRDLLLADPEQPLLLQDIDLVVDGFHQTADVGAGVELAKALQNHYPDARLEVHGAFQTAALLWHNHPELGSLWVDIATARTEFYPYPAANPEVEASSIRQDLYRRDFTINALALRLTPPKAGELLDFFGGLLDLRSRQIRVLHANSFIEDPTRIYRAVRFAVRLGFDIEPQTEEYIHYALASGAYDRSRTEKDKAPALQTRLKTELKYILQAPYWKPALLLLARLGALRCLHPELELDRTPWWQIRFAESCLQRFDPEKDLSHWQMRLEVLIAALRPPERSQVAENLQLSADSSKRLKRLDKVQTEVEQALSQEMPPPQRQETYQQLQQARREIFDGNGEPPELASLRDWLFAEGYLPSDVTLRLRRYDLPMLVLLMVRTSRKVRRKIWRYLTHWSQVESPLNGNDLKALGYKPGPQYREMLAALLKARLDGVVRDRAEAEAFLRQRF